GEQLSAKTGFKRFRLWGQTRCWASGPVGASAGHRFDTVGVAPLIKAVDFDALIADKALASDWIFKDRIERGAKFVISQHPRRTKLRPIDEEVYQWQPPE
ncbi:MAG: hypothetical protein ACFCUR_02030, partial [Rhodomicrobiaceae bacterium]